MIPIWDYNGKLKLNKAQLEKWAILDTLDGLYAKYDYPYSYAKLEKTINQNKFKIIKSSKKNNFFMSKIIKNIFWVNKKLNLLSL